jgi:hypothetical protein
MSDVTTLAPPVKGENQPFVDDFVWGARAIGAVIGRSARQTHHLLENGLIKSAKKVGGLWCCNRSALLKEFGA